MNDTDTRSPKPLDASKKEVGQLRLRQGDINQCAKQSLQKLTIQNNINNIGHELQ